MIAEQTLTINGASESVYLIHGFPNVKNPFPVTHKLKTTIVRSLTDRESRWSHWSKIRTEVDYNYDLSGSSAAEIRTMLALLAGSRCMVPLWHDMRLQTDWASRIYDPQYILDVEGAYIYAASSIGSINTSHHVVPLILCRLERPEVIAYTEDVGLFPFRFSEDAPFDFGCGIRDLSLSSTAFPSISPDWTRIVDRSKDRMELLEQGDFRERVTYLENSPMRWGQDQHFTLQPDDLHAFLSFWANNARGRYKSFIIPQAFKPHESATAETPDGYIGRFAEDEIKLSMHGAALGELEVRFWQLPWELNPPAGEEFEVAKNHYLYEFKRIIPDGSFVYDRFTSGEQGVSATISGSSYTFYAAAISHKGPSEKLGGRPGTVDIQFAASDGNPLVPWYRRQGEGKLILNIYKGSGSSPTGSLIFSGELADVSLERTIYKAQFGGTRRRKAPRVLMQRLDNHSAYAPEGGLPYAATAKIGDIAAFGNDKGKVFINLTAGSVSGQELSGGWLKVGSGATYESRAILYNGDGNPTSDIYVDLDRPLVNAAIGAEVTLYRFYKRTFSDCRANYSAGYGYHNFLGFPSIPVTDPSTENGTPEAKYGGKK